jgi:hypothetical protein
MWAREVFARRKGKEKGKRRRKINNKEEKKKKKKKNPVCAVLRHILAYPIDRRQVRLDRYLDNLVHFNDDE